MTAAALDGGGGAAVDGGGGAALDGRGGAAFDVGATARAIGVTATGAALEGS